MWRLIGALAASLGNLQEQGKVKFIASAAMELERSEMERRRRKREITRNTTLLLDDDKNNIEVALKRGTRALWFIPDMPDKYETDIEVRDSYVTSIDNAYLFPPQYCCDFDR